MVLPFYYLARGAHLTEVKIYHLSGPATLSGVKIRRLSGAAGPVWSEKSSFIRVTVPCLE